MEFLCQEKRMTRDIAICGGVGYSFGDGINFPERQCDEDTHTLLGGGT